MDKLKDRRLRVYSVGIERLIALLDCHERPPHFLDLPYIAFPENSKVVDVRHNWQARCFDVLVQNDNFDVVPECVEVPRDWDGVVIARYELNVKELVLDTTD